MQTRLALATLTVGTILLPAAAQTKATDCDRTCLNGFVDHYVAALVARNPSRLPLTPNAKYTENGVALKLGDGMWGPEIKMLGYKLYFADLKNGQAGFYGTSTAIPRFWDCG
jgi:hypothetical protein